MANSVKCPGCASNVVYDPLRGKLACSSCGCETTVEDIPFDTNEADLDMEAVVCNNCGSEVITDKFTSATFCAYCGASALVTERLSDSLRPAYIAPFEISREKANELFTEFAKNVPFRPKSFLTKSTLEKMTPMYVPFWLFDIDATYKAKGTGYKHIVPIKSYNVIRSKSQYYQIEREGDASFTLMPLDSLHRIEDELMESIEPFEMQKLRPYHPGYMSGFFANRYNLTPEDLKTRSKRRVEDYLDQFLLDTNREYDSIHYLHKEYIINDAHAVDYALLPVWFMHYSYKGKSYNFAVNGQTGEVAGIVPQRKTLKTLMTALFQLPVVAALIALLYVINRTINNAGHHASDVILKGAINEFVIFLVALILLIFVGIDIFFLVWSKARSKTMIKGIEPKPEWSEYYHKGKITLKDDRYCGNTNTIFNNT